jgi:hypothetical protein
MTSRLGLEDEIVLAAAHPVLSPERRARLRDLLASDVDWRGLVTHADRHAVAPILDSHLRALHGTRVPPDTREALAALTRACVASNLRLRHDLGRLLDVLERAGVPAMPLKGPVLADQLYPAPWLRASGDLDVLVPQRAIAVAERALRELGYVRRPDAEQGADYHTIFSRDDVDVELHSDLAEWHVSRLDVRAIWAAAARTRWDGHAIWSMALADQVLYLGFHAAKDGLASLRPLVDITLLLARHKDTLPWAALVSRVRAAHLGPVIYLALAESRTLLGAAVPDAFLEAIRPRHAGWALAQRLYRWRGEVLHVADDLQVGPFMAALMFLWEDTSRARLRHLRRNLLPSSRLRRRWTSSSTPASWVLEYPLWALHAARYVVRQLAARRAA